jgi:predicted dithiol-disulfide oxidoreductase (DUF899 family)
MSDARETLREIQKAEEELMAARKKVLQLRRSVPKDPVGEYAFGTVEGSATLAEFFGEKSDLILIHNMGKSCPFCTLWADGLNGLEAHYSNRAAFAVASPDSVEIQQEFAASRGWDFRMVSCAENTFIEDMGFRNQDGGAMPGVSAFSRDEAGVITRESAANFGPGDDFCSTWHILDLLKDGPAGWIRKYSY